MSHDSNTLIWIDTTSGTWGLTDDTNGALVLLPYSEETAAALDQMSDGEISRYGFDNGQDATLPSSPPPPASVWLLVRDDVSVFATEAQAKRALVNIVEEWWDRELPEYQMPDDDDAKIEEYFANVDGESYLLERQAVNVEPPPTIQEAPDYADLVLGAPPVSQAIVRAVTSSRRFETALNEIPDPSPVFGPVDVKGMVEGKEN